MPSNLKLRGHTYFVQKRVPKHLRPIIGQDLIVRTTGTTDRKVAESRRHAILA